MTFLLIFSVAFALLLRGIVVVVARVGVGVGVHVSFTLLLEQQINLILGQNDGRRRDGNLSIQLRNGRRWVILCQRQSISEKKVGLSVCLSVCLSEEKLPTFRKVEPLYFS
jgi:hypothetical protein